MYKYTEDVEVVCEECNHNQVVEHSCSRCEDWDNWNLPSLKGIVLALKEIDESLGYARHYFSLDSGVAENIVDNIDSVYLPKDWRKVHNTLRTFFSEGKIWLLRGKDYWEFICNGDNVTTQHFEKFNVRVKKEKLGDVKNFLSLLDS